MRALSNNETNSVTGAGYGDDIAAVAASIYVGSTIGRLASAVSYAAFAGAASIAGTGPLAFALGSAGAIVSPLMFFAAPVLAFDAVYPGVIEATVDAYFK